MRRTVSRRFKKRHRATRTVRPAIKSKPFAERAAQWAVWPALLIAGLTFYYQFLRPEADAEYSIIPRHYHYDTTYGPRYEWVSDLVINNNGTDPLIVTFAGHVLAIGTSDEEGVLGVIMAEASMFLEEGSPTTRPLTPCIVRGGEVAVIRVTERPPSDFVDAAELLADEPFERRLFLQFEAVNGEGAVIRMAGSIARFSVGAATPDFEYLETEWINIGRVPTLTSPPPTDLYQRHTPETW